MPKLKPTPETRFLSVNEAAQLLDVSSKHIFRLIEAGHIPAVNVSPKAKRPTLRIPKLKFEAIIRQWETPKAPAPTAQAAPVAEAAHE